MPVAERNNDLVYDVDYLKSHKQDFISCCNEIIGKYKGANVTSTKGTIDSSVVHGTDYDHESVSSGDSRIHGRRTRPFHNKNKNKNKGRGHQPRGPRLF